MESMDIQETSRSSTVKLISSDGVTFEVPLEVAQMSGLIKGLMDTDDDDDSSIDRGVNGGNNNATGKLAATTIEIPLPNVKSSVLQKVINFCEHSLEEPMVEIEKPLKSSRMVDIVQRWYSDFIGSQSSTGDKEMLFELILAANYMDVKPLLELTCATIASMIKGKTPEEIRSTFHIVNDFTPEEEAQVKEENKWCEDV